MWFYIFYRDYAFRRELSLIFLIYYNITWGMGSSETPKFYYVIYEQPHIAKAIFFRKFIEICVVSFFFKWKSKQYCNFLCMWLLTVIFSALLFHIGHTGQLKVHLGFGFFRKCFISAYLVTTLWKWMANEKQFRDLVSNLIAVWQRISRWKQLSFISHISQYSGIF